MNWPWKKKCEHDYEFVRNIYGDEINQSGGYRSIWQCKKCGKIEYRKELKVPLMEYLDNICDNYMKTKYQKWQNSKKNTLDKITNDMIDAAKNGQISYDIILICNEEFKDKYYYEQWLTENKLKVDIKEINKPFEDKKLTKYNFHIRWNYKY